MREGASVVDVVGESSESVGDVELCRPYEGARVVPLDPQHLH